MADISGNKKPSLKLSTGGSQDMPPPPTTAIKSASTPATENPRPILKLNTGSRAASFSGDGLPTPGGSERKIKIKINASQPGTPSSATPLIKTKAGRLPKPTSKIIDSKKRSYSSDEDQPLSISKKIKVKKAGPSHQPVISASTPLGIKWRARGEPVKHRPGDAYDSEADDKETDPVRETLMILRTLPGPSTEYLRNALEQGTVGVPKQNGGADVNIQFIEGKERRAMVTLNGEHYAAVLVDLPTITEAMKSWDRKAMMKNSDVTQMLLCFTRVKNEAEAKTVPLPAMAQMNDLKWPHGLTPPMHDAVNRRFRKILSEKQLASVSSQVKKLIADDANAESTHIEYIQDNEDENMSDSGADAEGEEDDVDYFGPQADAEEEEEEEINDADLEAEFEAADLDEMMMDAPTPATQAEAATPMTFGAATPAAPAADASDGEADDDDEEEEVSEEDDEDDEELDEEEQRKQAEDRESREDLRQLQKQLSQAEGLLQAQNNPILRKRIFNTIVKTKEEIALKKAKLGIQDD